MNRSGRLHGVAAAVLAMWPAAGWSAGPCVSVPLVPVDDAFVRAAMPTTNYGSAGALSVAGPDAVNTFNVPQGQYETVMKVDAGQALAALDAAMGAGNWTLTGVELVLTEESVANNTIFNRGLGDFEVFWLSDDSWVEGPGTPLFPVTGTGNQMTWDLLQTSLASATRTSLGTFSNLLADTTTTYPLPLAPALAADILAGGMVSLHLAPVTPTIGFNFKGSDFLVPASHPRLVISAETTRGDVNCDTLVDLMDADALVLGLLDPAAFAAAYPGCPISNVDVNADGATDAGDISMLLCAILP
jgi:hypothetical protein